MRSVSRVLVSVSEKTEPVPEAIEETPVADKVTKEAFTLVLLTTAL